MTAANRDRVLDTLNAQFLSQLGCACTARKRFFNSDRVTNVNDRYRVALRCGQFV
jgi:hypothetical protein